MNDDDPFSVQTLKIDGELVTISTPTNYKPSGVTFLLPGAEIGVEEYNSHRDVLIAKRQIVLSFFINVLWPLKDNHRIRAKQVKHIFDNCHKQLFPYLPELYNIVGHSVGGKIALLVPVLYDPNRVQTIIALDPVDQAPTEFTNTNGDENLSLFRLVSSTIIMTCTDGGCGISADHNAEAIHKINLNNTILVRHNGAGHMAYTDHGGRCLGDICPKGTPEGDKAAWNGAHELIRHSIGPTVKKHIITKVTEVPKTNMKRRLLLEKMRFVVQLFLLMLIMIMIVFTRDRKHF